MRILILSNTPWNNSNSFGNTFSNLFSELDDVEIANIYCRYGHPNNSVVSRYFQITEKSLIRNLCNHQIPSGNEVYADKNAILLDDRETKTFNMVRKHRWQIFFLIRDFIWKIGRWDSLQLREFIDDFSPDLLYLPLYYSNYLLDMDDFLIKYTDCKTIGHVSDDIYSFRQISISPFFWIDRFIKRKKIRQVVNKCEFLHVISEIQKTEYEKKLGITCRIFRKRLDFKHPILLEKKIHHPVRFVYTGNLGNGRWKSLVYLGSALKRANVKNNIGELLIYTSTPITKRMQRKMKQLGTIQIMGNVTASEVEKIQQYADVLVHVESLKLKERFRVHQSFSTKIVDYMHTGNCILAIGKEDVASIRYLKENDAAVVAQSLDELENIVKKLLKEPKFLKKYGKKAWIVGRNNHDAQKLKEIFKQDLQDACKK